MLSIAGEYQGSAGDGLPAALRPSVNGAGRPVTVGGASTQVERYSTVQEESALTQNGQRTGREAVNPHEQRAYEDQELTHVMYCPTSDDVVEGPLGTQDFRRQA